MTHRKVTAQDSHVQFCVLQEVHTLQYSVEKRENPFEWDLIWAHSGDNNLVISQMKKAG